MALTPIDRELTDRCLRKAPGAWSDFIGRFSGLLTNVIRHSAEARSIALPQADEDEILAEVFLAIVNDDSAVLRRFAGRSSLATYLTVVARRVAVAELIRRRRASEAGPVGDPAAPVDDDTAAAREVVDQLLQQMPDQQAKAVRMHHIDGRSYRDVGRVLGVSENSVGSILTRARRTLATLMARTTAAGS